LKLSVNGFWQFVVSWPEREKQMQSLSSQFLQIVSDKNALDVCQQENNHLKKLLGASLPSSWKFTEAKVIGDTNATLHINRGKRDGVAEGMNVVYDNVLIGRIEKANETDANLVLLDRPDLKIPVQVSPFSQEVTTLKDVQAKGIMTGGGSNILELDRVLQEEKINKDDFVISSGQDGWLPNLLVGRVDQIVVDKTAIYQKATVLPLVDYKRLDIVFVVIKN
jgi:rod shape-determining protein MreC